MTQQQQRDVYVGRILQDVRRVQRSRMQRDSRGVFWVEGVRQFLWAVEAGFEIETIVVSRVLLQSGPVEMLLKDLAKRGVRRAGVTPEEFRSICLAERASGIGAIVKQRWTELARADMDRGNCWVVIEEIRLAGNLGTILRTAEAVGAAGVILLSNNVDVFEPGVVRASMGGVFCLQLMRCAHEEFGVWARENCVTVVGLAPRAEKLWTEVEMGQRVAIVLGEERAGLSSRVGEVCDVFVRLPMSGKADSINVGVAAGVMLYEVVRRKFANAR